MDIVHAKVVKEDDLRFKECGIIKNYSKAEFSLHKELDMNKNDFEIQMSQSAWLSAPIVCGDWVYIAESEWGGRVEKITHTEEMIKVSGVNFRYLLNRDVLLPPYNQTTKKREKLLNVNGYIEDLITQIKDYSLSQECLGLCMIDDTGENILVEGEIGYLTYMEALEKLIENEDIYISVRHNSVNDKLMISIKELGVYEDTINKDYNIEIDSSIDESEKVDLIIGNSTSDEGNYQVFMYRDETGAITELDLNETHIDTNTIIKQIFVDEKVNSLDELKKKVLETFSKQSLKKTIELFLKTEIVNFNIGDVISGIDEITTLEIKTRIIEKKLVINEKGHSIEYKVGD
ncbi:hypothetical protein M2475_000920 [Breznakia sp. PF5-3]|uniref:Gp37-like protein n=1 Tax=unclassified Breznakia TaxID=2623764 RepID=UPI002404C941|nr:MULTISPECIES: hypothetical protein [unclassified Breznakia]MDF9824692.1 hypothetical protein [Breznakia sp. PM6-1]MDF9835355.1 hypothetical protein [Breznakia sp. PF5-3]MDF9836954.1 hypothetical protein [Breznakia sp. PFB2-8]MDF9859590.1 hypothetical protein [Breznakia sp. PH5-24]